MAPTITHRSDAMFTVTPTSVAFVRDWLTAGQFSVDGRGVKTLTGPSAAAYLSDYKRRPYRTERVPVIDRCRYELEFHYGERSCCTRHPVIHDTPQSFLIAYDDICIGLVGFDVVTCSSSAAIIVSQVQGSPYVRQHSGRLTGAEGPAKSVSWQPALLNLVVAAAPLFLVTEVIVLSHLQNKYPKVQKNWFGNADRLYDGTAEACGFAYDSTRQVWTMHINS